MIEVMKQALEFLETGDFVYPTKLADDLRQAIERAEQRADAHLFYAQGDVLICKESNEKAVVMYGNTGLRQLVNGKIALAWSDEVYGEYTLEQIMDGFIREVQPEQPQPALTDEQCDAIAFALDDWALNADSYDYGLPIHNEGQLEKVRAIIRAAYGIKE